MAILLSAVLVFLFFWLASHAFFCRDGSFYGEVFAPKAWEKPLEGISALAGGIVNRLDRPLVVLLTAILLLLLLAIWSFLGGAVLRASAVEITSGRRIFLRESLAFAKGNFFSFLWPPVQLGIGCLGFTGLIALTGLAGLIPGIGMILFVLLLPFFLVLGAIAATVGAKGLIAYPLMGAATAVERSNSFDALSRAFSYLYSEPYIYLLFSLMSLFNLCLGLLLRGAFFLVILLFSYLPLRWVLAPDGADLWAWLTGEASLSSVFFAAGAPFLSSLFMLFFGLLLAANLAAHLYSTRICFYLFFRWKVDKTPLDRINLCEEEKASQKSYDELGFSLVEEL